jgi:signal peptidase I
MLPTLAIGDRFLVDKRKRPVRRGDVVVFRIPPRLASQYLLRVKRAVALAGDTVEMRDGALLVNGTPVSTRQIGTVRLQNGLWSRAPEGGSVQWGRLWRRI